MNHNNNATGFDNDADERAAANSTNDYAGLFSGLSLNGNNLAFHHQQHLNSHHTYAQPIFDTAEQGGPVLVQGPAPAHVVHGHQQLAFLPHHFNVGGIQGGNHHNPQWMAAGNDTYGIYGSGSRVGHSYHAGHGLGHGHDLGHGHGHVHGHTHNKHAQHPPPNLADYDAPAPAPAPARGWGGQALASAGLDSHPNQKSWFGKGTNASYNNGNGGRRGRYGRGGRGGGRAGGNAYGRPSESSGVVEKTIRMLCQLSDNQRMGDDVLSLMGGIDSRDLARLLKELSRMSMANRAVELFDAIRVSNNASLLDVFTYTAAISLCIATHDVERALRLAEEMKHMRIQCNVHTFTALMNVCIKCSRYGTALETYETMRREGCIPNVVTFNTLIDVYGKTGAWEQAARVLDVMRSEGVEPVLRTYNTLLIACNMCNQPREAILAYKRMVGDGFSPNSTTYNALISAYGKSGQLDKVMEVFQEMSSRGCEKNVITYSSLISACEKAGQWELALELFQEMGREQCNPNTVTFNSLITALGQGGQWEKAKSVFDQMKSRNCTPDVVTYTALISAMEKGGQWGLAIEAFERMMSQGCKADAIVYNAVVNALWETGVIWAQRHALRLFKTALAEGHFPQQSLIPGLVRAEVNLHATTSGVAMLSLYVWLVKLRRFVEQHGAGAVPRSVTIVTDRGRGSREQGNSVIKESVNAIMASWKSPFVLREQRNYSGSLSLEASGEGLAVWHMQPQFADKIFSYFPCSELLPGGESEQKLRDLTASGGDMDLEAKTEKSCVAAFAAVKHFEKTHCLVVQNMGFEYLQKRAALAQSCVRINRNLGSHDEVAHDAILLMDRVMSTSLSFASEVFDLLAASCVAILFDHSERESEKDFEVFEKASGLPSWAIKQMEWSIRQILNHDTQSISSIRCVKLLNERLGVQTLGPLSAAAITGSQQELCLACVSETSFLNCRPSIVAAAVVYVNRRERGAIPFWPSSLSRLTGYNDVGALELSVAIKAAQRITSSSRYTGEGADDIEGPDVDGVATADIISSLGVKVAGGVGVGRLDGIGSIGDGKEDTLNAHTEAILNSIYDLVSNSEFPITPEETESSAPNGSTERSTSNEGGSGSSNNDDGSNNDDSNESNEASDSQPASNDSSSERENDD